MIERTVEKQIASLAADFKILFVTGSRQVGKTTLLKSMKETGRDYVTLDDSQDRELAANDAEAFFMLHPAPVLIDEAQRAPEIFIPMKKIVDSSARKNQIWITGSQKPRLKKQIGDTLSGRVAEIEMYPLSQAEKQNDPYRPVFTPSFESQIPARWTYMETLENIVLGGYPGLQGISRENRGTWFRSYINTYLLGDIRNEMGNMDQRTFTLVLKVLAARTATSLNYSSIAEDTGLSAKKIHEIIDLLESCGIIFTIPPYSGNPLKSLVRTPRLHFTDSGLCCHLLGIHSTEGLLRHPARGAVFESYAISEVIRNARNNGDDSSFYFYREENKGNRNGPAEIDLIKEQDGQLFPMEIKMNASPTISMAKNFVRINRETAGMGTIICLHERKTLLSRDVLVMPVSLI